jgi:glucose-6-phosphate 1-dehydrogenase
VTAGTTQAPPFPNPLAEGLERLPIHPTALVIFGATGDLARRKLLPALYNLAHDGALPERIHVVGVSRSEMADDEFRAMAAEAIRHFSRRPPDEAVLRALLEDVRYVAGTFDEQSAYRTLADALAGLDADAGQRMNRCFYLSTAPMFFPVIVQRLGESGLNHIDDAEARIVIEKPFGTNLAEALELNRHVLSVFHEHQVFRIDHYLGKETVQNILAMRFANHMFEPVWNRNYVEEVQITAAEDIGIESRAEYYDRTGALRDLIQNHMLQLLCHVAMEPPVHFSAEETRNEKVKVLQAIEPRAPEQVSDVAVRAQYGPGALRLEVDNWRWAGVPFYLRTGKRLARKVTEIAVTLKPVPHLAFTADDWVGVSTTNQLILTIQPDEGVSLSLAAKIPGVGGPSSRMRLRPVLMQYLYGTSFLSQSPEAYERLILDAMRGDATLFTRNDEVEAQWRICDPILHVWESTRGPLPQYPAGSQGPQEANRVLLPGHAWRAI